MRKSGVGPSRPTAPSGWPLTRIRMFRTDCRLRRLARRYGVARVDNLVTLSIYDIAIPVASAIGVLVSLLKQACAIAAVSVPMYGER